MTQASLEFTREVTEVDWFIIVIYFNQLRQKQSFNTTDKTVKWIYKSIENIQKYSINLM